MKELFNEKRKLDKNSRDKNMEEANPIGWTIHTFWHWSKMLNGNKLDYWPSKKKFMYRGKVKTGDVLEFIKRNSNKEAHPIGIAKNINE